MSDSAARFFARLGRRIDALWRGRHLDEAIFHEVAVEALREAPPVDHVRWLGVIDEFMRASADWPPQRQDPFGQPPVTLFSGDRFFIQMLIWLDATTAIHSHAFSGAFHVLHGSSMHGRYGFRERRRLNAGFAVGDVEFRDIELLTAGDTRPIRAGRGFLHSLFHLEEPSVTIVIRTVTDTEGLPQMEFHRPHLAEDAFLTDQTLLKRRQVLSMLGRVDAEEMLRMGRQLIEAGDFQTCWHVVETGRRYLGAGVVALVEAARERHGALADVLPAVLDERGWRDSLVGPRSRVSDPELRFFLALLLNVPQRETMLDFTTARFGDGARERMLGWLRTLSEVEGDGQVRLLQMSVPPLLETGGAEPFFCLLAGLLEGRTLPLVLKRLGHDYGTVAVESRSALIREVFEDLRRSPLRGLI